MGTGKSRFEEVMESLGKMLDRVVCCVCDHSSRQIVEGFREHVESLRFPVNEYLFCFTLHSAFFVSLASLIVPPNLPVAAFLFVSSQTRIDQ